MVLPCKMCWAKQATRFVRDTEARVCSGCFYMLERTLNFLEHEAPSLLDLSPVEEIQRVSTNQMRMEGVPSNGAGMPIPAG